MKTSTFPDTKTHLFSPAWPESTQAIFSPPAQSGFKTNPDSVANIRLLIQSLQSQQHPEEHLHNWIHLNDSADALKWIPHTFKWHLRAVWSSPQLVPAQTRHLVPPVSTCRAFLPSPAALRGRIWPTLADCSNCIMLRKSLNFPFVFPGYKLIICLPALIRQKVWY